MSKPVGRLRPVHPGEVLREDFLIPLGLSVNALALALGVPATLRPRIGDRKGKRTCSGCMQCIQ